MSLLIKALDKAQEAKAKQGEKAKKTQSRKQKSQNEVEDLLVSDLSLAEPGAELQSAESQSVAAESKRQPKPFQPLSTQELLLSDLDDSLSASITKPNPKPTPPLASKPIAQPAARPMQVSTTTAPSVSAKSPVQNVAAAPRPTVSAGNSASATTNVGQDRAANVFGAKRIEAGNQNAKLALLGGMALLVLGAIGFYFYRALHQFDVPQITQAPPLVVTQTSAPPTPVAQQTPQMEVEPPTVEAFTELETPVEQVVPSTSQSARKSTVSTLDETEFETEEALASTTRKASGKPAISTAELPVIASRSASVSVTRNKQEVGINPTLMRAYEAYIAGNDSEAQVLYKQVLQRDIRNVDALLGLGAIAIRQGREADANGWYRKVLEVEPRNAIAQSALLESQPQANELSTESQLKNMIEKSPDDANLHAKLGNFYADQNQWQAAQQAYFEAHRLKPTADNALNLAVSLDHIGKHKLALPYYEKALEQIDGSSAGSIDRAALEARISAIQSK